MPSWIFYMEQIVLYSCIDRDLAFLTGSEVMVYLCVHWPAVSRRIYKNWELRRYLYRGAVHLFWSSSFVCEDEESIQGGRKCI